MESLLRLKVRDVEESYRRIPACKIRSLVQGRLHPQYRAVREEGEAWAEARIAPVLSKAAMDKLRSTNCVALACYLWPNAEGPRALTFVKFSYWVVLFDDVADDPLAMGGDTQRLRCFCSHFLHAMFGDGNLHTRVTDFNEQELLTVELGREWWSDVTRSDAKTMMPPGLQARMVEAMRSYVMAQPACAELRAEWEAWLRRGASERRAAPPCTLEELRVRWRVASGSYLAVTLTEYDVGIELDKESLASPLLRQLIDAVGDQWNWVNNIFSFPKDLLKQEILNFLALLHLNLQDSSTSNLPCPVDSFQVTLEQAWDIAAQLERDCIDLATRIAQHEAATPAAQRYADALCTSLASHLMWFAHTTRYPHTNSGSVHQSAADAIPPTTFDPDIQSL